MTKARLTEYLILGAPLADHTYRTPARDGSDVDLL